MLPQGVSVEAVDPVFQAKMLDMLKQTGRPEMVVGWYHSHPGFGCWLSGVDINTQQSFEALSERAVAVVIDPIQSVKGKVVIDAFRLINPNMMVRVPVSILPASRFLLITESLCVILCVLDFSTRFWDKNQGKQRRIWAISRNLLYRP